MEFSEKLLQLRRAQNLTQEQLAEQLNVSRQSVSKWESGQALPEVDKLIALGKLFNLSVEELLCTEDFANRPAIQGQGNGWGKGKTIFFKCLAICLTALAVMMLLRQFSWQNDFLWRLFPGVTMPIILILLAAALCVAVYVKEKNGQGRGN